MALAMALLRAGSPGGSFAPVQAARGWLCSMLLQSPDAWSSLYTSPSCRSQHIMPRTPERQTVVPTEILRELRELDDSLTAASRPDGRHRSSLPLSAHSLHAPLPYHVVEPGLPSLDAHVRPPEAAGSTPSKWLRRSGRVPGRVHSLPSPTAESGGSGRPMQLLVHFDENELGKMVRTFGRNGCTARVLQLNLVRPPPPPSSSSSSSPSELAGSASGSQTLEPATAPGGQPRSTGGSTASSTGSGSSTGSSSSSSSSEGGLLGVLRVKPVRVHMNSVTQRLEGVDLIYCPADRVVLVDVPVRLVNDDQAPGVRKGGWMAIAKRTVRYKALGSSIPPYIEVNVRHLDLDQDLLVRELPIPPGTKIYEKDFNAPVLRCTTDVGKD